MASLIAVFGSIASDVCRHSFTREKKMFGERVVDMAYIGFRVYRKTDSQYRKDARGTYEGWSDRFDEWIPLYSPRLMPYDSKSGK